MESITNLIGNIGFGDLVCDSFEAAKNNTRKKNLVIIDDSSIYKIRARKPTVLTVG